MAAQKEPLPAWKNIVAGGSAGIAEVLVMYPLDVVKTRSQLSSAKSPSIYKALSDIIKKEGPLNLYRGISAPIVAEAPKRAIKFTTNEKYKGWLRTSDGKLPFERALLAGGMAGTTEAFINCPFEIVKVRMQAKENLGLYKNTFDCAKSLVSKEGASALMTGIEPMILRNAFYNGIYFGVIGACRNKFPTQPEDGKVKQTLMSMLYGTIGGAVGVSFATPFDVVKSRVQNTLPGQPQKYGLSFPSLATIYKEEGFLAIYKGFTPRLIRLSFGGGIMLIAFDIVSDMLR
eukprot:GFYU01007616.1.p1 GENE.GFYU01007616.1~~GFYU01007616.1.p1  ORF type:complete len:288 (+),score=77.52 GFYU01007616.1:142-1005(+)